MFVLSGLAVLFVLQRYFFIVCELALDSMVQCAMETNWMQFCIPFAHHNCAPQLRTTIAHNNVSGIVFHIQGPVMSNLFLVSNLYLSICVWLKIEVVYLLMLSTVELFDLFQQQTRFNPQKPSKDS